MPTSGTQGVQGGDLDNSGTQCAHCPFPGDSFRLLKSKIGTLKLKMFMFNQPQNIDKLGHFWVNFWNLCVFFWFSLLSHPYDKNLNLHFQNKL